MLKVRVVLDLVNSRWNLGRLENGLDVLLQKIGNSDGFRSSRGFDGFQIGPFLLQFFVGVGKPRCVDEIEVDIVEA